ncbi:MAG: hypothetical protein KDJ90_00420 [Nitratireductor sp.]|nr:hypothetical protein [Nitratireductor sp.]
MADASTEQQSDVLASDLEQAEPKTQAKYWLRELDDSKKHYQHFIKQAKNVERRYRDERKSSEIETEIAGDRDVEGLNILYSNTETMKGAVYANPPTPVCERRFPGDDVVARVATEIMERALIFVAEDADLHGTMKKIRHDYLLPGRGVARAFYEIETDEELDEGFDPEEEGANPEKMAAETEANEPAREKIAEIINQRQLFKRYGIDDYLESVDKTWEATRWIAYRSRLSRKKLIKRYGKDKAVKVQLTTELLSADDEGTVKKADIESVAEAWKRAEVWEIWDKSRRLVWHISPGYADGPLDVVPDPLGLRDFFPGPRPAMAVESNETKIPLPLYWLYCDQAAEVDRVTKRIYSLVNTLRVNGAYAGEESQTIKQLFSADNELIAIADFAAWADKGGISKLIEWLPNQATAEAIRALYEAREQAKQELFEISGMADIIRGSSDPRETLGAQKIKGQFATIRLETHQENHSNFARDLLAIAGEIIAEHYSVETLERITGIKLPRDDEERQVEIVRVQVMLIASGGGQDQAKAADAARKIEEISSQPTWEEIFAVLRDDTVRRYRIRVETDSTIKIDQERDRQQRVEAIRAVAETISTFGPAVMAGQMPFDLFKQIVMFLVRGLPGAREIEAILDEWKQPPPPQQQNSQPDPSAVAAIREKGATERELLKVKASADENERQRAFDAAEAEKDRSLDVMAQTIGAAKAVADAAQRREQAAASMRNGNGA